MRAAVLGCGPSGLIAAHAAVEFGATVKLFTQDAEKSSIFGAQFLYEPIPGVCDPTPDGDLHNVFLGDVEEYRRKIYGDPTIKTTWDNKAGAIVEPVWDLRSVNSALWERFKKRVTVWPINSYRMARVLEDFDVVISSIPLHATCVKPNSHVFDKYQVRIVRNSHQERLFPGNSNICIYNGLKDDGWFRFSHMFGYNGGFELPAWDQAEGSFLVQKPTNSNCDCWPDVIRVGRYGRWDMRISTHHSWGIVMEALNGEAEAGARGPRTDEGTVPVFPDVSVP